jgi:hypothetical protein
MEAARAAAGGVSGPCTEGRLAVMEGAEAVSISEAVSVLDGGGPAREKWDPQAGLSRPRDLVVSTVCVRVCVCVCVCVCVHVRSGTYRPACRDQAL